MSGVFVRIKDKQLGPFTSRELKNLAQKGEFNVNDWVYQDELQEWVKAGTLEDLQEVFQPPEQKVDNRKVFAIGGGKGGVGKTSLTASIGIALAAQGFQVVIVDADLAGANLHTCMGILEPEYTFYHFYTLQRDSLSDILLDTPVENLKLISGACGTLGLANPRYSQKQRFISELRKINADFIILDLGAGASYNVIDFFLAADQGIAVTTPEPMAIQETFNFIKIALLRKLMREFRSNSDVLAIFESHTLNNPGRMNASLGDLVKEVKAVDEEASVRMEKILDEFRPQLILNMVHSSDEVKEGVTLRTAVEELLDIDMDYLGYIEYDDSVRKAIKELRPFVVDNPKSKASRSLAQLVSVGMLGQSGWKGFRQRRKTMQNIKYEAQEYPSKELKDSDVICSVKCFYWGDCEYQNGGFPCPVRHLDPIFRR